MSADSPCWDTLHCLLIIFLLAFITVVLAGAESGTSAETVSLFKTNCAICHGEDGTGTPLGKSLKAPDLTSEQVRSQSSATLASTIKGGKNSMPPFGDRLDSEQIKNLVAYVHKLGAKPAATKK